MNYYRLYLLSAPDGRFVGFEEIEADDDAAAISRVEAFVGEHPLELWCGSRKVRGFAAKSPVSASTRRPSGERV